VRTSTAFWTTAQRAAAHAAEKKPGGASESALGRDFVSGTLGTGQTFRVLV